MKITGDTGFVELVRCDAPSGAQADEDILLNVAVGVRGFAAEDQAWVLGSEWAAFVAALRSLDHDRLGRARVEGKSPDELLLEIFSTDRAGHMALVGNVRRPHVEGFTLALEFGFTFEPELLPRIVHDCAELARTAEK